MRRILVLFAVCAAGAQALESTVPAPATGGPAQPAASVRLWASPERGGEPRSRFLPGQEVFFSAQVEFEGAAPGTPVTISLWLAGPEGWRTDLLPRVQTTAAKLEPLIRRSHSWPEDLSPALCGPYQFSARVECMGAVVAEKSIPFTIEAPLALEQAWVDIMPLARPRTVSNRLEQGLPFYFHARHRLSDLVSIKDARLTVEWRVFHGSAQVPEMSVSVSKTLSEDPQELVLTRNICPNPPGANMLGASVLECTAALGGFRASPVRATFVVTRRAVAPAPGRAAVELLSVSAQPGIVHPGDHVVLSMKYRVSGLREGEVLPVIERQMVTRAGRQHLLPMRSTERGNGTYELKERFAAPRGATGRYLYEASVLALGRVLCQGHAAFQVQEVEIRLSDMSIWPATVKPGENIALAFRFSVSGLAGDESLAVERVVEVKGPWAARFTKKGALSAAPGVSYRTRLEISVPRDAPAGKYALIATLVPERGAANKLQGSFEVRPH